jgi:hypothetical protein
MARMSRPCAVVGKEWKPFPTYTELKKKLKELIGECPDKELTVFRSRRGEWGEWFEKWIMSNGKPKIIKEGWM